MSPRAWAAFFWYVAFVAAVIVIVLWIT